MKKSLGNDKIDYLFLTYNLSKLILHSEKKFET